MPLNPEPSAPEDREAQHLAPKSYADAAEEALHQQSRVDSTTEGTTDAKQHAQHQNYDADQLQFEGAGQDETPKSPARGSHRRNGSNKSNGSIGQKHTDMPNGDMYEKHQDGNGKPLTSVKPAVQFEKPHRTDGKPMRRNSELKSGRQAGAGWHRSKYAAPLTRNHAVQALVGVVEPPASANARPPLMCKVPRRAPTYAGRCTPCTRRRTRPLRPADCHCVIL